MGMGAVYDQASMTSPTSSPPSSPTGTPKALTPEQKRAMKTLISALYVADKNVRPIPKDGMLTTDFITFSSSPIKKHMVWTDTWWSWNQSNAKSYAYIDKNTFVTIRKLNPRKHRGVGNGCKKPAYKLWIFHIEYTNYQPCWCLWCERGIQNDSPLGFASMAAPLPSPALTKRLSAPVATAPPANKPFVYPVLSSYPPTTYTMDVSVKEEAKSQSDEADIMPFSSVFPDWTDADSKVLSSDWAMADLMGSTDKEIDRYFSSLSNEEEPRCPGSYMAALQSCDVSVARLFPNLSRPDSPMMD